MRTATALLALAPLIVACAGDQGRERPSPEMRAPAAAAPADPDDPRPVGVGYVKPRLADPTCVAAKLRQVTLPPEVDPSRIIRVEFAVTRDARVVSFGTFDDAPEAVLDRLRQAVSGCDWIPGKDRTGRPVSIWVILPLRFWDGDVGIAPEAFDVK